jgi:hypothetical protein
MVRKGIEKFDMNPAYLFRGEGPMFGGNKSEAKTIMKVLTVVVDKENNERIAHVPVPAHAGYASQHTEQGYIESLTAYDLPNLSIFLKDSTQRSFEVSGDSMEPTLFEGDVVICNYIQPGDWATDIRDKSLYVVVTNNDVLIKRVDNRLTTDKTLLLVSDNPAFEPYHVPYSEIREIWPVRSKISAVLPTPSHRKEIEDDQLEALRNVVIEQSLELSRLKALLDDYIRRK